MHKINAGWLCAAKRKRQFVADGADVLVTAVTVVA